MSLRVYSVTSVLTTPSWTFWRTATKKDLGLSLCPFSLSNRCLSLLDSLTLTIGLTIFIWMIFIQRMEEYSLALLADMDNTLA
ncbi:hypothetical protein DSUL_20301 [Desulfovibrionales bacterium]